MTFWVLALCSMEGAQHFEGTYHLHHQSHRLSQAGNQQVGCLKIEVVHSSEVAVSV
jgi:hypothetical protein